MSPMRQLSPLTWLLICTAALASAAPEEPRDVREGEDVTLPCRFEPHSGSGGESLTHYWVRTTPLMHDNVAIQDIPLQSNYQVQYFPEQGRYDLLISNTTYERDNGRYECRVKAAGSGRVVHAQAVTLVVLIPPGAPAVSPGPHVRAQEAHVAHLTCSTLGGSPPPTIKWYRGGSPVPLAANVSSGGARSEASTATLAVPVTRDDDGATYRCVVWNRAMPDTEQLEAVVDLSVNYYPRVEIGPENPLRVEAGATASMECRVDAKPEASSVRWTRNGQFVSSALVYTVPAVSREDSGEYVCVADNGLGRAGQRALQLDVLYPPAVTVHSKTEETEEGGTVEIRCDVAANPEPVSVEWTMEGKPDFKQRGNTLLLTRASADMAGTYTCRAVNVLHTSAGKRTERAGSASVAVLVRHRPGRARISPERPVAQEGAGVTLTCAAAPPGWPAPQYRWFRDTAPSDAKPAVLATGPTYAVPSAHLGSEGVYYCHATNELGHGESASVTLEVHQPPRFQAKLQPHATKRAGERGYSATCGALGKPRPRVTWLKDGAEITPDANLYEVATDVTEGRNAVYTVQSTLRFSGAARAGGDTLLPEDRGIYSCTFENEVKKVDSTMHLRIEHEPIAIKQKHKVAYDLSENAEISCRVIAYPKPELQWYFGSGTAPLQATSEGRYEINTSTNNNDSYLTALKIRSVKPQDYGEYYCRAQNALGAIRPQIRLQAKGAPEAPRALAALKVGPSFVTLGWEAGFDGGLSSTKYFVRYKRVGGAAGGAGGAGGAAGGQQCAAERLRDSEWMEYDCGRSNPCNVTRLDQHDAYLFKVKAVNTKGQSNYSNEITVTTKVDRVPPPEQVTYEPRARTVTFSVGPTCLALVAIAEALAGGRGAPPAPPAWRVVDLIHVALSGTASTVQEGQIDHPFSSEQTGRAAGRGLTEQPLDELNPRLRLKLCLEVAQDICSDYIEAEIGPSYIKEASVLTTPRVVAIVVSCFSFLVFLALLFIFCRCKKNIANKETTKEYDYEMDSMKPSMVTQQNQAPPPYYPSTGMENKGLEHSMELALSLEDSKSAVYASQSGYGYHVAPHAPPPHQHQHHAPHQPQNGDWGNMGYIENSYTNSNHAGSVNSQDSLWQMKMAAANTASMPPPHQMMDRQSNYGYDPIAHGGYGTIDDYAPYPHLPPAADGYAHLPPAADGYARSQQPSRQEYCSDPYASVHKPKKRIDQHIESPYHEVSGLPEAYGGAGEPGGSGEEKPPGHMSLSYDESMESGYSTPNSRARRVIREIIV